MDKFENFLFSLALGFGFGLHIFIIESIIQVDLIIPLNLYIIFTAPSLSPKVYDIFVAPLLLLSISRVPLVSEQEIVIFQSKNWSF